MIRVALVLLAVVVVSNRASATLTILDGSPGTIFDTSPLGINDAGQVVGGCHLPGNVDAGFLWNATEGYTTFSVPGAASTSGSGINSSGQVVGSFAYATGEGHGFIRNPDGAYTLFDITTQGVWDTTGASKINDLGQVVGNYRSMNARLGFLRDPSGAITTIAYPGAERTYANDINNAGTIVGWYGEFVPGLGNQYHGFLRDSSGNYTSFDLPGALRAQGNGINDSGEIVGDLYTVDGGISGFLRAADGTFTSFAVPGAWLELSGAEPSDINNSGQIVGRYFGGTPDDHGQYGFVGSLSDFVLNPEPGQPGAIPEPLTMLSALLGTVALGGYVRRRARR